MTSSLAQFAKIGAIDPGDEQLLVWLKRFLQIFRKLIPSSHVHFLNLGEWIRVISPAFRTTFSRKREGLAKIALL
jgi:hypothetical protein